MRRARPPSRPPDGHWADDDLVSAPTIDPVTSTEQVQRSGLAMWIRRLAVPIIIGWIALLGVLNVTVGVHVGQFSHDRAVAEQAAGVRLDNPGATRFTCPATPGGTRK
jgi:hypothetical protein